MTTLKRCLTRALRVRDAIGESATVFLKDVGQGLLEVSHNMLALIGLPHLDQRRCGPCRHHDGTRGPRRRRSAHHC